MFFKGAELLMNVVIAMNTDGESVRMSSEQGYNRRLASIKVPGDEGYGGMKVMLLRLPQKLLIFYVSIGFAQPEIVNCQVGIVTRAVPHLVSACEAQKHHLCGDCCEDMLLP